MYYKHGYTAYKKPNHPLYNVWLQMKQHCYNPNNKHFKDYGRRGISISSNWLKDPAAFIRWALSNGYQKGLLIDRIDNDSNYSETNCRFATPCQSARNKRRPTNQWCKKSDLPLGVQTINNNRTFCTRIAFHGKRITLGTFKTPEEASEMYQKALRYIKIHKILNHRNDLIGFED